MARRHCYILRGALAVAAVTTALGGCGGSGGRPTVDENLPVLATVTAQQLWTELFSAAPPPVIDVRDAAEYELAHVPGSQSMPHGRAVSSKAIAPRASGEDMVIVGDTETDARRAAAVLLAPGESARTLEGGMAAWDRGLDINDVQLKRWIDTGSALRLIDVRTHTEWHAGRIDGTENLPLDQLDAWAATIGPSEEVVLICGSGFRSAQARDALALRGCTRVHNLVRGINAWRYELVEDPG